MGKRELGSPPDCSGDPPLGLGREQLGHRCLVSVLLRNGVWVEGWRGGCCSQADRAAQPVEGWEG